MHMNEERYDLMFSGELVPGFELAQVKKNLQQLFRLDENKISALFSGKSIPLKKGVDSDAANKYRVAMKKAGARVELVLVAEPPLPVAKPMPSAPLKPAVSSNGSSGSGDKLVTTLGAQPVPAKTPRAPIVAPDFGLSAPGADLLLPDERVSVEPLDLDISHLSVAPQRGHLLGEDERMILPGIAVTVPDFDVAEAGSDLLKPEERQNVTPLKLDLSHLSVAKPGERLGPVSPPAPPPPDVAHLKLKP